ncbi:MAG: hypothetical protein ABIH67_02855 [Candidatus Uhrbacteria bacterium]
MSCQPPSLNAIFKALGKLRRRLSKNEIRGIATRTDSTYTKATADDLVRFLLNTNVLLSKGGYYYFDPEQAQSILDCCASSVNPSPMPDSFDVLVRIDQLYPPRKKKLVVRPLVEEKVQQEFEPEVIVPEPVSTSGSEPEPELDTPMQSKQTTKYTHVVYLTLVEFDLWECLQMAIKQLEPGDDRIPVPRDMDRLFEDWATVTDHDSVDYGEALERFIQSGVVQKLGSSGNDHDTYRFTLDPETVRVVRLEQRLVNRVAQEYVNTIRWVETKMEHDLVNGQGWTSRFKSRIRREFPELNSSTIHLRFSGYRVGQPNDSWGIIYRQSRSAQAEICLPFLEPYDFVADGKVKRQNRGKKQVLAASGEPKPFSATTSHMDDHLLVLERLLAGKRIRVDTWQTYQESVSGLRARIDELQLKLLTAQEELQQLGDAPDRPSEELLQEVTALQVVIDSLRSS